MRANCLLAVVLIGICAVAGSARANLINLTQQSPDITVNFCSLTFNSGSGLLAIAGSPVAIDYDGVGGPDFDIIDDGISQLPLLQIGFVVNSSGNLTGGVAGHDLLITGLIDLDGSGDPSGSEVFGTLLTGEILAFGYQSTGSMRVFDMVFAVTGGLLAGQFGPQVGLIFDAVGYQQGSAFTGSFQADFANGGTGNADVFAVPEPATAGLLLAGLAVAGIGRRRRSA